MTSKPFLHAAFLLLCFAVNPSMRAEGMAPAEKARVEALITHLENLKEATFIRNGSDYDSKAAAKFLRGKWQTHEKEIKTATDFIAKAATRSSTSGRSYLIRLKGGPEIPCAEYLTAQLKKLESAGREK